MTSPAPERETAGGVSRRGVLATTAGVAAAAALFEAAPAHAQTETNADAGPDSVELRWLEGKPAESPGSTWGIPWGQGRFPEGQRFQLVADEGATVPVQTWPLAYWPDGSLKWTGHAVGPAANAERFTLSAGKPLRGRSQRRSRSPATTSTWTPV